MFTIFSRFISGSSYILYCSPEGYEEKAGFHRMCGACRALRELPQEYFPRFLNEVRCGGTQCIKGNTHMQ